MSVRDPRTGPARAAHRSDTRPGADAEAPLSGCAALVTGASSGIGAATAWQLARQGAAVAVVARRTGRLEELATSIRDQGGSCAVL
ncbi:SDR family NAD(P)-dependent oxidoreductase, partial [Streptomyces sp. NPDC056309]|uniref:SDR family NAD(P)-dependent oxidoreductase n=1 Tax=Streptomyces sp. NPDC056309 TaxID=3345781 RepID=UPI0035E21830